MLAACQIQLIIIVASVACMPLPMSGNASTRRSQVQRVESFQELFSTTPRQHSLRDTSYAPSQDMSLLRSGSNRDDFSAYDLDYIKDLLHSPDSAAKDGEILPDVYDTYAADTPEYEYESSSTCHLTAETKQDQGSYEQGQSSRYLPQDADEWPLTEYEYDEPSDPRRESTTVTTTMNQQDEQVEETNKDDMEIMNEGDDFEAYFDIYRRYAKCVDKTARIRLKKKLNDGIKGMLNSGNVVEIEKACHILSSKRPGDVFNLDDALLLIDRMESRKGISRKMGSSIIRLGQVYFPKERKQDLYGDDEDKFDQAFALLHKGYIRKNAERTRGRRAKDTPRSRRRKMKEFISGTDD